MKNLPNPLRMLALLAAGLLCAHHANAQNVWVGVNGTSATTNWSDVLNWSLGSAPSGEGVIFQDNGAVAAGVVNNVVNGAFVGSAASLQYANINNSHTTLIANGVTLSLAGALIAGTEVATDIAGKTNTITGLGGTLVANSPGANFIVRQWPVTAASSASRTTLDMSGLGTFTGAFDRMLIGVANSGGANRASGRLILAKTNTITLSGSTNPQMDVGDSSSNNGNGSQLLLGQTNALFVNTITVGRYKERAVTMNFMAGLSSPTLYLRGSDGSSRVNLWNIGDMGTGSATANAQGTVDLTGGILNAQVETLVVGRASEYTGASTTTGPGTGLLTFNAGTLDVNTLRIGYQGRGTSAAGTTSGVGTVNVNGTALLLVNTSLELSASTGGTGVASTTGTLNINGGTVVTPSIAANFGGTNNSVTISGNGTLVVSNTAGPGINKFAITNGTLTVAVSVGSPTVVANNVALDGTANTINITDIPIVSGYPAQFTVIQYAGTLSGTFNIGVGTLPASSPAYAGFISNNVANMSIDLVLTGGKLPARSLAWRGAPDGNWDTTTANWLFSGSPTTYHEEDFVRLDDTATGSTTVILTATRVPSGVTVSNQTKAYTLSGPGNLSGTMGITKDGAAKLTIANSGINDNTGGLTIQAGTVQVGDGSSSGNLGPGNIANDGSLIFARADVVTVADTISGTGGLTQNGAGTLTLNAANTYTGNTTVSQGTLQVGNAAALGSTNGGTIVASGATLDFNGRNIGLEPVTVSGSGVGGAGALVNNGADIYPAVAFVTMTGNTVFGGSGRWDLRSSATGNPNLSSLLTGGQPYKLTKVGANPISIVGATVDPALGDVEIQGGTLGLEAATTSLGNSESNLTVWPGAQLKFYNVTNQLNKKIYLGSDGFTGSVRSDSGANTIAGPITMTNDCIFTLDSGTSLTLDGALSGGLLTMISGGNLIIGGAATHAGTYVSAGKLVLNGTHSGGITNPVGTSFAGSGINTGFSDVGGALLPGDTNLVGTLTLSGLLLQFGAEVFLDLGPTTTVGGSANDLVQVNGDLVINGNSLTINPQGPLLKGAGSPYTVIKYTGNLIENSPLTVTGPYNYTFTVDTTVPHEIRLVASGGPPVWNGGSALTSNWSDSANWGGIAVAYGDSLYFGGSARLNNMNDTTAGNLYNNLAFVAGAGAFTLNGNSINLGGSVINDSVNTQTVNLDLSFSASRTFSGSSGMLVIGGSVTNTGNTNVLTLEGTGILSNRFVSADVNTITNILALSSTNGNWTLVDNPSSLAVTNPTQLDIQAGTLNFGAGASAPILSSSAANHNSRLGVTANSPATFNMVNGTLTIAARLNTGGGANTLATFNQSGGTFNVALFQGADSSATAVSTVNVSGGLFTVGTEAAPNSFFLCSRGTGTLTVSGSGLVRCGTFDVSRNASGAGSTGVVNLNGGTLNPTRVGTGTGSFGAGGTPTATFNFNGGTLKAWASSPTFFQGRTEIPITSIVKSGGAIIDSDTNAISVLEPLQHDSALGATPDGGLTKLGTGTLTLTAVNTYTGPTLVNAGTLLVSGSLAAAPVTVAPGGTLAGTGSIGGTATINASGTVAPGIATGIGTLTVANAVLNGTTFIKLNKSATPATNDVLAAASLSLGGTLEVANTGPLLQSGDAFTLFRGTLSGSITPASLPPLWPGLSWNTSSLNTLGRISVTGTMLPPTVTGAGVADGNFTLSGSGGLAGTTYYVLASTNAALPLASWARVATNVFDGSGNFTFTKPADQPRQFFVIQTP